MLVSIHRSSSWEDINLFLEPRLGISTRVLDTANLKTQGTQRFLEFTMLLFLLFFINVNTLLYFFIQQAYETFKDILIQRVYTGDNINKKRQNPDTNNAHIMLLKQLRESILFLIFFYFF